jgi:hypothetical protein
LQEHDAEDQPLAAYQNVTHPEGDRTGADGCRRHGARRHATLVLHI